MKDIIEKIASVAESIEDGQEISNLKPVLFCLIASTYNREYLLELGDIFQKFSEKVINLGKKPTGKIEIEYIRKLEPLITELSDNKYYTIAGSLCFIQSILLCGYIKELADISIKFAEEKIKSVTIPGHKPLNYPFNPN